MRAGRLHASVIAANMEILMSHLRAHGFADGRLEQLHGAVLSEVRTLDSLMDMRARADTQVERPGARFFQRLFAVYAHKVV